MSKTIFCSAVFSVLLLTSACLSGCGYKIGNLGHPQLKSVAIAPVVNDTLNYNASAHLRGSLSECFQTDGTMKLTGMNNADCIVYARLTNVAFSGISWSAKNDRNGLDSFTPTQWRVVLTMEFSVVIPGRATPLIKSKTVTGEAEFTSGPDVELSRNYAIKQAGFVAAKKIVAALTEAW